MCGRQVLLAGVLQRFSCGQMVIDFWAAKAYILTTMVRHCLSVRLPLPARALLFYCTSTACRGTAFLLCVPLPSKTLSYLPRHCLTFLTFQDTVLSSTTLPYLPRHCLIFQDTASSSFCGPCLQVLFGSVVFPFIKQASLLGIW